MARSTVNGIKLNRSVDETTRKQIERAGSLEDQMRKAAELDLLDHSFYKRVAHVLKYIANDFW
jgi:hypothetical protein